MSEWLTRAEFEVDYYKGWVWFCRENKGVMNKPMFANTKFPIPLPADITHVMPIPTPTPPNGE